MFQHNCATTTATDSIRGFADDTSLTCADKDTFQAMIYLVCRAFYVIGLELNSDKTSVIVSPAARAADPNASYKVPHYTTSFTPGITYDIKPLAPGEKPERYLGIFYDSDGSPEPTKAIVLASMKRVCDFIAKGNYSVAQAVQMVNCLVMSKLRYSIPCLSYQEEELKAIDVMARKAMKGAAHLPNSLPSTYCYLTSPGLGLFSAVDIYDSTLLKELYVDLNYESSPMFHITRLRLLDLQDSLGLYTPILMVGRPLSAALLQYMGPINRLIHSIHALGKMGWTGHFNRNHPAWDFDKRGLQQGLLSATMDVQTWLDRGLTCIKAKVFHVNQISNDNGCVLTDYITLTQRIPDFSQEEYEAIQWATCKPNTRRFKEEHVQQARTPNTVPLHEAMRNPSQLRGPLLPHQCDLKKGDFVVYLPSLAYCDAVAADEQQYKHDVKRFQRLQEAKEREERLKKRTNNSRS